jgi:hypothetical protein
MQKKMYVHFIPSIQHKSEMNNTAILLYFQPPTLCYQNLSNGIPVNFKSKEMSPEMEILTMVSEPTSNKKNCFVFSLKSFGLQFSPSKNL